MCENPLISIIVPAYNIEKYIRRCVDSILHQTYKNWELIIGLDGCTDSTPIICREYEKIDKRIHIVDNKLNFGVPYTRNACIEICKGDYVLFLDGDDFLTKDAIELLVGSARGMDLVCCGYKKYYGLSDLISKNIKADFKIISNEEAYRMMLSNTNLFRAVWAKLFSRRLVSRIIFDENLRFGEDMRYIAECIILASAICYAEIPLYYYNQEGESLVRSSFNTNKMNLVYESKRWIDNARKYFPKLIKEANECYYVSLINTCSLCIDIEFIKTYDECKRLVREELFKCLKSDIGWKDKIKAIMVAMMRQKDYRLLRNIINNGKK